jgi:tagaturonate epimerase
MTAPFIPLGKNSIGVGDRFAHQARAQLKACMLAGERGAAVIPVWNKSNREHSIVGSGPASVREAADAAVHALGWRKPFHVDADHINLTNVDRFIDSSDFYTIDVAGAIGEPAPDADLRAFLAAHPELSSPLCVDGIEEPLRTAPAAAAEAARHYLAAVREAGRIYRHILQARNGRPFITEVSMDETEEPQTPPQLLLVLAALAGEGVPVQTVAPKFTGRFNKGVDYVGNVERFEREFHDDVAVLAFAVKRYGLPASLKLSVHSGSDKFSIYAPIRRALSKFDAGVHIKTAGTTWLEELIGLAEAGGEGLEIAKLIYAEAWLHREDLCAPYANVIDIDPERLPGVEAVSGWSSGQYVAALRHDQTNPAYNPHLRQLLHVGYKVAAGMGKRYLDALARFEEPVSRNVTRNLFERHMVPLFL